MQAWKEIKRCHDANLSSAGTSHTRLLNSFRSENFIKVKWKHGINSMFLHFIKVLKVSPYHKLKSNKLDDHSR